MTGHGRASAAIDLSRDDIRVVQRVLIERGLLHGKADGVLGPKTREAISAFQRQQGIQETGSIDARTVSSLGVSGRLSRQANQSIGQSQSSSPEAQTSTNGQAAAVDLSRGDIRIVQRALIERHLLHGKVDGVPGPKTREAIRAFQRQQGIQVTGSLDARTVSSLGVSDRLSQQANQSINQSQSSPTGAQTSTAAPGQAGAGQAQPAQPQPSQQHARGQAPNPTAGQANSPTQQSQPPMAGHGQAGAGQVQTGHPQPSQQHATGQAPNPTAGQANNSPAQQSQPSTAAPGQVGTGQAQPAQPQPGQQHATGQVPNQTTGQANNPPVQQSQPLTTGQSTVPSQSNTTGQATPQTLSGNESTADENAPSGGISLTFTDAAAIGFIVLALGAFILVPAI
jgi:peptidoglycan hydrolase-like protein with peptidoglycan-binding domain